MTTSEVISIGKNETDLVNLKIMYENKLNTPTKLIKCFGKEKFDHDWRYFKRKCKNVLDECKHKC